MDSSNMMSGESLSLNDFVSAQVEQLIKVFADPPPHPLEKISQIQGILSHILKRKQKENLVLENVEYSCGLAKVMKAIQLIVNDLTVTTDNLAKCQDYKTGDDQSWTKTNINRALKDLKKLGEIIDRLTPMEEYARLSCKTLEYWHRSALTSMSHCESELTSFLRQIDFRQYLDNTSKAGILADCPDDHCAICLVQKLTVDVEFTVLDSCRHIFCTSCIDTWLSKENSCPMCRKSVDWAEANSETTNTFSLKDMVFAAAPLLIIFIHQIFVAELSDGSELRN